MRTDQTESAAPHGPLLATAPRRIVKRRVQGKQEDAYARRAGVIPRRRRTIGGLVPPVDLRDPPQPDQITD